MVYSRMAAYNDSGGQSQEHWVGQWCVLKPPVVPHKIGMYVDILQTIALSISVVTQKKLITTTEISVPLFEPRERNSGW